MGPTGPTGPTALGALGRPGLPLQFADDVVTVIHSSIIMSGIADLNIQRKLLQNEERRISILLSIIKSRDSNLGPCLLSEHVIGTAFSSTWAHNLLEYHLTTRKNVDLEATADTGICASNTHSQIEVSVLCIFASFWCIVLLVLWYLFY